MIYSLQQKFLFVHVSRTGGTSLTNLLYSHCPDAQPISPLHSDLLRAQTVIGPQLASFYKFAVVRNPWERLHSWYALLSKSRGAHSADSIADPAHNYWRGFDAFLEQWLSRRVEYAGVSRPEMSQSAQLSDAHGNLAMDHIARFENYTDEIDALCTRFGWPSTALTHENSAPKRNRYQDYYSRHGAELVAQVLSEDLRLFGYRF